jgi:tRNA A37 threonylcarbamoyladenosine synthetase subunit TsaC/SUA5/YrdC
VFTSSAERLSRFLWPGRVTMVLPSPEAEEGIAVRVSHHPFIKAVFPYINRPLYSTSANLSDEAYRNVPEHIFSVFSGSIDFFIDAGPLPPSPPSTIVKIEEDDTVTVLREGAVTSQEIFSALH